MNKLTIKKSTWHFRLAKTFGWKDRVKNPDWGLGTPRYVKNDDFCSYLRRVLLGLVIIGMATALLVFYVYCNVLLFVDLYSGKFVFANGPARQAFAVVVDSLIAFVLVAWLLWKVWFNWGLGDWSCDRLDSFFIYLADRPGKAKRNVERDPFYKAAYDSLKHKFCMKIEVTDE